MKSYSVFIGLLFCLLAHGYIYAAESKAPGQVTFLGTDWELDMAIKTGYVQGDTTYKITFLGGASELVFPLQHTLLDFQISLGHKGFGPEKAYPGRLSINWAGNISTDKGQMEDSDWIDNDVAFFADLGLPGSAHAGKDIYSESDAKLRARIIDVNYTIDLSTEPELIISALIGYYIHKLEYEISDLEQVGYGPYAPFTVTVPGKTLEYRVRYEFPYLGAKVEMDLKNQTRGYFYLGFSSWVTAKDLDDHILRHKIAKSDCTGSAFIIGLGARRKIDRQWFFEFDTSLVQIDTDGIQQQTWYGDDSISAENDTGSSVKVNNEITASLWTSYLGISYKF